MWHFKLLILFLLSQSCLGQGDAPLKSNAYAIAYKGNQESKKWAEYLYKHLKRRATQPESIKIYDDKSPQLPKGHKLLYFDISDKYENDYCIDIKDNRLFFKLKTQKTMAWIIYQIMKEISNQNSAFEGGDLPPTIINFSTGCHNFDFVFREPFYAPNTDPEYAQIIGTNNVDVDWGLWGHHLDKIAKKSINDSVYAWVNDKLDSRQLNFSSPQLFGLITRYIIDNFGEGDIQSYRFMIAPNDNDLVSMDSSSVRLGNTKNNATPALARLLTKLAHRFPQHQFYTIAYKTTQAAPVERLPDNVGVFVSTINLPKGVALNIDQPEVRAFLKQVEEWQKKVNDVYVWDYAGNFDDYLTPIPTLFALKQQLQFFKTHNIKGVFLNASGYDYSSFDDLKTFVSAALMMNVETDIETLIHLFFQYKYPENHQKLTDYYLRQEEYFQNKKKTYPMYGGIREILNSYLETGSFIMFYKTLEKAIDKSKEEEKSRLKKLYTALTFTRLQVAYGQKKSDSKEKNDKSSLDLNKWIETLERLEEFENINSYKEKSGNLKTYIEDYKTQVLGNNQKGLLIDIPVIVESSTHFSKEEKTLLNDGVLGFPSDYHMGWLVSNKDLKIRFVAHENYQNRILICRFLRNERYGIYPPDRLVLNINGKKIAEVDTNHLDLQNLLALSKLPVTFLAGDEIEIIIQSKLSNKFALDEIQLL